MHARRPRQAAPCEVPVCSTNDAQQPRARTAANEALGVARRNLPSRERVASASLARHELLQRPPRELAARVTHLAHDVLPAADVLTAVRQQDAVLDRVLLPALDEIREQRAEELELSLVARLLLLEHALLDVREHLIDVVRITRELSKSRLPRTQLAVPVPKLVDGLLELDEAPDSELIPVVLGRGEVELIERGLVLAAVVENVREIDARLGVLLVELQRAAQVHERRLVVAESVVHVAQARRRLGQVLLLARGDFEELARLLHHLFAEQRAPDLQHEIEIVLVPEIENLPERLERFVAHSELEKRLAESGK